MNFFSNTNAKMLSTPKVPTVWRSTFKVCGTPELPSPIFHGQSGLNFQHYAPGV